MTIRHHQPVMVEEVIRFLEPMLQPDATIIDCTLGSGGHAQALLERGLGRLIGIDRDPDALQRSREFLKAWENRIAFVHDDFRNIMKIAMTHAPFGVDAILADFGVSMDQLRDAERGFSFEREGPLDMRYNPWDATTAAKIVNQASYDELNRIFREYGEFKNPEKITRAILESRRKAPIETTTQLAEIVTRVLPRKGHLHPATRVFMALRIAVNRELDRLDRFLVDAFHTLKVGGRLVILAYHSLEDRTVKRVFQRLLARCRCDPSVGVCLCESKPLARSLTKKVVRPSSEEIKQNPAARSARLRAIEKIHPIKFRDLVLKEYKPKPEWPFPLNGGTT